MNKKERLLFAIGEADEKYIKEAQTNMGTTRIIKAAVVLVLFAALSLYLFIPFAPVTSDLTAYEGSSYFPLIEGIEDYRLTFMQPKYKNNFQWFAAEVGGLFGFLNKGGMAPGMDADNNMSGAPELDANGSYIESTDNQVNGVIESDLMKMTDKYIFRLTGAFLRVYSIAKENSELVSEFEIPTFMNERGNHGHEMYLSLDCNTVTVLKQFYDYDAQCYKVGLISIDVSDVMNMKLKGMISVDGDLNTSRMVDGKLLLVTNYTFNRYNVDYNTPETFVPTIDSGNGKEPIEFENIIYPENVDGTDYSVVALIDTDNLSLLGANALLNFTDEVYVSAENIFVSREYVSKTQGENTITSSNMSDVAVLGYADGTLTEKGVITLKGHTEDQYSFDELDGYLRVVTSTRDAVQYTSGENFTNMTNSRNASLYIVDLKDNSVAYSLESFAIEGEEATAVRFDGDKVYVCTAVVVTFTDPVYFIDLSDYESITSADTGVIEGYSDHLINYGEGMTLGIGRENWQYSKVEIYAQQGDKVVSVHEYKFNGEYSLDYKAYLVNRENNLFGFAAEYFYEYNENDKYVQYSDRYILIRFDEQSMYVYYVMLNNVRPDRVRAVFIDGYLYVTTDSELIVEQID